MYWPARRRDAYNVAVITGPIRCSLRPTSVWYPPEGRRRPLEIADFGPASLEGGDVMPIGTAPCSSA